MKNLVQPIFTRDALMKAFKAAEVNGYAWDSKGGFTVHSSNENPIFSGSGQVELIPSYSRRSVTASVSHIKEDSSRGEFITEDKFFTNYGDLVQWLKSIKG